MLVPAFAGNQDFTLKRYAGLGHSLDAAASLIDDLCRPIAVAPMVETGTHGLRGGLDQVGRDLQPIGVSFTRQVPLP